MTTQIPTEVMDEGQERLPLLEADVELESSSHTLDVEQVRRLVAGSRSPQQKPSRPRALTGLCRHRAWTDPGRRTRWW
jgi:hypothetical protein